MIVALWTIAICEVVRVAQNLIQIKYIRQDTGARDNAYAEFVKSLKSTDREFVKRMLEEFNDKGYEQGYADGYEECLEKNT